MTPNRAQDGPKWDLTWAQMGSKGFEHSPRCVQDGRFMWKVARRWQSLAPEEAELAQDGPKMAPRWPKMAPERPQIGPR